MDTDERQERANVRYYVVALFVLLIDQWAKWMVVHRMEWGESIPVLDGFFHITSHRNRGAAFGMMQNQQWLFILVTLVVAAMILYYLWKRRDEKPWASFALALILGGAIGNLLDRIRTGEVVDFLHFFFRSYEFPVFNLADAVIVVGVGILVVTHLFGSTVKSPVKSPEKLSEARDSS
jgi:signal peptidase II